MAATTGERGTLTSAELEATVYGAALHFSGADIDFSDAKSLDRREQWRRTDDEVRQEQSASRVVGLTNKVIGGGNDLRTSLNRAQTVASHHDRHSSAARRRSSVVPRSSVGGSNRFSMVSFAPDIGEEEEDKAESEGVSALLASFLTANFISVGYLFCPYAFATTGIFLTSSIFAIVMLQSFITSTYVMEACTRAEMLAALGDEHDGTMKKYRDSSASDDPDNATFGYMTDGPNDDDDDNSGGNSPPRASRTPMEILSGELDEEEVSSNVPGADVDKEIRKSEQPIEKRVYPGIEQRKFEIPELCRIFLGDTWKAIFTFTTCCDLYGITWSIAAVFASSLSAEFSIRQDHDDYFIFAIIFAAIVAPLSMVPVVDQLYVQLGFFLGRMAMVLVMLFTTLAAFASSEPHFGTQPGAEISETEYGDFGTLHTAIQICIFSTALQFSVPVIAQASQDRSKVRAIYAGSTGFVAVTVFIFSIVLALYFGPEYMEQSSNINWSQYHAGTGTMTSDGERVNVAWWAKVLSKFVLVYPAVDGISTFVLCAVSLGEIIRGAWYADKVHEVDDTWGQRLFFRIIGSCPQIVGAVLVRDLSIIATYAGLFTVASYYVCPCLLQIYSQRIIAEDGLTSKTKYRTIFSNEASAWTLAMFGTVVIIYAIVASSVMYG